MKKLLTLSNVLKATAAIFGLVAFCLMFADQLYFNVFTEKAFVGETPELLKPIPFSALHNNKADESMTIHRSLNPDQSKKSRSCLKYQKRLFEFYHCSSRGRYCVTRLRYPSTSPFKTSSAYSSGAL